MRLADDGGIKKLIKRVWRTARMFPLFAAVLFVPACTLSVGNKPPSIQVAPEPAPQKSVVLLPVSVPLADVRDLLDNNVPRNFSVPKYNLSECNDQGACGADPPACKWNAGYSMDRGPIAVAGSGQTVTMSANASYWLSARVRVPCPGPLIGVGCGDENNPNDRRHLSLALPLTVGLTDDWDTSVKTGTPDVNATDDCKVGPFGVVDVTGKVAEAARNSLARMGGSIDAKIRDQAKLQEKIGAFWTQASSPIMLAKDAWLLIHPDTLTAGQPNADNQTVAFRIGLVARPEIVLGPEPPSPTIPLPKRRDPGPLNAFVVNAPVNLPYDVARDALRKALRIGAGGIRVPPLGKYFVRPTDVDVEGFGPKVVISAPVEGKAPGWWFFDKRITGTVYLVGTPAYDPLTGTLSFPDLDFSLDTKNKLAKLADFLNHEAWRDQLRGLLQLNIKQQMDDARTELFTAMNSQHGDVTLSGTIDQFGLLGIWSNPEERVLRAYGRVVGALNASTK